MTKLQWGFGTTEVAGSQQDLRHRWETMQAVNSFQRLFNRSLLPFVGSIDQLFSPPQSPGFLFTFAQGMRGAFLELIDGKAFPERSGQTSPMTPDNPGRLHRDAWWRGAASAAAIGASFREEGTLKSLHIAISNSQCDVHVDRNGFVVTEGGFTHWDMNALLRHVTIDLAGDKLPLLVSATVLGRGNRPVVQATLGPWFAVDLPSRENPDRIGMTAGVQIVGNW
jgi:hypothetical protein